MPPPVAFHTTHALLKGVRPDDERYVLGVVLEPDTVDAQGDIYSAQEVERAAHRFMEQYRGLGWMHRTRVQDRVRILESYLAPVDFTVEDVAVRKGTWLLALRIDDDSLWAQVREGALTGLSIGGSARRVAEPMGAGAESSSAP